MVTFDAGTARPEARRVVVDCLSSGQNRYCDVLDAAPASVPRRDVDRALLELAKEGRLALRPYHDVLRIERPADKTDRKTAPVE